MTTPLDRSATWPYDAAGEPGLYSYARDAHPGAVSVESALGALDELPDIESDRSAYDIIGWELEPGDAVFFDMLTAHCAGGVEGPHRRRVLSLRILGDDVTHAPRDWRTSPEFPGLADELAAGAPMDHPLFPVVWERTAS